MSDVERPWGDTVRDLEDEMAEAINALRDAVRDAATIRSVKQRLGLLWDALDALRRDFDRTGEHDRANSILAAQEHVEELQREVGGL